MAPSSSGSVRADRERHREVAAEPGRIDTAGAAAAALAALPGMTPRRLADLLAEGSPVELWMQLRGRGHPRDRGGRWRAAAAGVDLVEVAARHASAGVEVLVRDDPAYPDALRDDPGAPAVLFAAGRSDTVCDRPRVAVVGTRSATPYGRRMAAELGRDLASVGVSVVSGLALGIDAASHAGALSATAGCAPPVAVIGTGLDVVYPEGNAALWEDVRSTGVIFSEAPLGTPARARVFPARNRIIAALSDVVVVVECHAGGGALYTVEAAARRGMPVCAVPGSVYSRASAGTNGLLVDGCIPVRDATDVEVALSLARAGRPPRGQGAPAPKLRAARGTDRAVAPEVGAHDPGFRSSRPEAEVLSAIEDTPTTLEQLVVRTGLSLAEVATACRDLAEHGLVTGGAGWWSRA